MACLDPVDNETIIKRSRHPSGPDSPTGSKHRLRLCGLRLPCFSILVRFINRLLQTSFASVVGSFVGRVAHFVPDSNIDIADDN